LIGWGQRNWPRLMNAWFPTGFRTPPEPLPCCRKAGRRF
jgi:hypothetical protein